jgi:4-carboxymuconolactone decarboxylase
VQRLQVARRELALEAAINRLDHFDLVILDDFAYVTKNQAETSVLFELISARYERRSLLITANQPFGEWGKVFPDPAMTLAAVDRLVHHSTIFELNVGSYRRRTAMQRKQQGPGRPAIFATPKNVGVPTPRDKQPAAQTLPASINAGIIFRPRHFFSSCLSRAYHPDRRATRPTPPATAEENARMAEDRLPPIPEAHWSEAQRRVAREIIDGPRGALVSPFVPMLRSPELTEHAQRMGEYLRYRSAIELRLSELAILVTARQWSQQVEWAIHAPIALREGLSPETVAAIGEGRRPSDMKEDEALVHDFAIELHRNRGVSDTTWHGTVNRFGEQGAVDLVGINGYYTFLSMMMNTARTPAPASSILPLREMSS